CLGLLWFVARGEWRHLIRALAMTLVLVATSYLLNPALWREWVHFLLTTGAVDQTHLLVRTAAAAIVVVVAARLNKAWCLPIAMWFAAPVLSASSKDLAVLTGSVRLWRRPSND
ncbi:MAG TPA: glycosyltransferase 87 family protein, partial [Propionibacteriaceae bacterium]